MTPGGESDRGNPPPTMLSVLVVPELLEDSLGDFGAQLRVGGAEREPLGGSVERVLGASGERA